MELIYSMKRKPIKCERPQVSSPYPEVVRPLCSISVLNVIAFSSGCELEDAEGETWGGHVYVCDLDTPWDAHKVASVDYMPSCLEWDCEGRRLVVGTVAGTVSVYGQKDHLLNKWTLLYTHTFDHEPIVAAIMFHNGRRVTTIESADANITDRLHALRMAPTLPRLGGVAVEGCLIITSTGVLAAVTQAEDTKAHVSTEMLRHRRDLVSKATAVHKPDGSILVAAVCPNAVGGAAIRVSSCSVRLTASRPMLQKRALSALHRPLLPTCIAWTKDHTDSLYIGDTNLSLWRLDNKPLPVHKSFVKYGTGPTTGPKAEFYNTLVWQRIGAWPLESPANWVSTGSLPKSVALVTCAGTLVRVGSTRMCSLPIIPAPPNEAMPAPAPPAKRYKYSHKVSLCGCSMSALSGVAVCVDSHAQLHVCKAMAVDTANQASLLAAVNALEYCAVSGWDPQDILMNLASAAELLHDRLSELFSRQQPQFQQYYYHSFQRIKISLLRLVARAFRTVSSLTLLQSLHLAWACVSAALRPDDKPDSAPVAAMLDDKMVTHHDKALLALEAKSDPIIEWTSMAALRCQLKRAQDIAVTAIAAIPHIAHPYELYNDPSAILLLRKLMVVARPSPAISRLLAKLPPQHHSKDLMDECASLAATHGNRVWECPPRTTISSPHGVLRPIQCEYFVEPPKLRIVPEPPVFLRDDDYADMDSVTYMYLSMTCSKWRACARCAARAAPLQPPRAPSARGGRQRVPRPAAVANRMTRHCKCGGRWTLITNVQA